MSHESRFGRSFDRVPAAKFYDKNSIESEIERIKSKGYIKGAAVSYEHKIAKIIGYNRRQYGPRQYPEYSLIINLNNQEVVVKESEVRLI